MPEKLLSDGVPPSAGAAAVSPATDGAALPTEGAADWMGTPRVMSLVGQALKRNWAGMICRQAGNTSGLQPSQSSPGHAPVQAAAAGGLQQVPLLPGRALLGALLQALARCAAACQPAPVWPQEGWLLQKHHRHHHPVSRGAEACLGPTAGPGCFMLHRHVRPAACRVRGWRLLGTAEHGCSVPGQGCWLLAWSQRHNAAARRVRSVEPGPALFSCVLGRVFIPAQQLCCRCAALLSPLSALWL